MEIHTKMRELARARGYLRIPDDKEKENCVLIFVALPFEVID